MCILQHLQAFFSKNDQIMINNEWILIILNLQKKYGENFLVDSLEVFSQS